MRFSFRFTPSVPFHRASKAPVRAVSEPTCSSEALVIVPGVTVPIVIPPRAARTAAATASREDPVIIPTAATRAAGSCRTTAWGNVRAVVCSVASQCARESRHPKSDYHGLGESSARYLPGSLGSSAIFTVHAILLVHSSHSCLRAHFSIGTDNPRGNRRRSPFAVRPWPTLGSDFGRMGCHPASCHTREPGERRRLYENGCQRAIMA